MTLEEQIDFFFAGPDPEQTGDLRSTLHLVRREVQDCLIGKVVDESQVVTVAREEPHRLVATMMVLMAGVDLLAKCTQARTRREKCGGGSSSSRSDTSFRVGATLMSGRGRSTWACGIR